jgi:type I restriction enzyme, S subunit
MKAGWVMKPLGALCKTGAGGTPLKSKKEYYEGGNIPWLLSGEVSQGEITTATNFITQKGLENSSARLFPANTVLVAMYGATAGQVGILRFPASTNQAVCGILPNEHFLPEFLFYFFMHKKDDLVAQASGNAQPNISQIKIRNMDVPEAPVAEQQRVVAILDESFDGIAIAKANAEANLLNARAVFESHLDTVLSRSSAGYIATTLGAEVDLLAGYAFPSGGYTDAIDAVRLLRGDNIMQGYFRWEEAKGWPSGDCESYSKFTLQEGDVVIAMDRPWVKAGLKRAQICADDLPALLVQRTSRLRTLGRIRMDFLSHLTGSQAFSRHLLEVQTGIGVPHISGKQIESFKFMLPPLSDQVSIANTLSDLLANTLRLEKIYEEKLTTLDELKKSLLHRAFSGCL